jgi:hypothetical protein
MRRPYQKSPELWGPGLNVNVAASLLGQFGNDSVNLERVEERRIERDQSNAPSIRRASAKRRGRAASIARPTQIEVKRSGIIS